MFQEPFWPSCEDYEAYQATIFQSRNFLLHWLDTIGAKRSCEVKAVIIHDGFARPALMLPLFIDVHFGFRCLKFIDAGVADYNTPIIRKEKLINPEVVERLWPAIIKQIGLVDYVEFEKMPAMIGDYPNPMAFLANGVCHSTGYSVGTNQGDFFSYTRPKRRRREMRKVHSKNRALQQLGDVQFKHAETVKEAKRFFDFLSKHKRRQWIETRGWDVFENPGVAAFYEGLMSETRLNKVASIAAVTLNGQPIAAGLFFQCALGPIFVLTTYDPTYASYGAGRQLLVDLINWSFEEGFNSFNLGVGDSHYKTIWATDTIQQMRYCAPLNYRGRIYTALRYLKRTIRALLHTPQRAKPSSAKAPESESNTSQPAAADMQTPDLDARPTPKTSSTPAKQAHSEPA